MELFENLDLPGDSFNIFLIFDPRFFKYFDGHLYINQGI